MPRRTTCLCLTVATALSLAGCNSHSSGTPTAHAQSAGTAGTTAQRGGATGTLSQVPAVVTKVEPSVVTIRTPIGLGSGVVYRADGTIVTDAHVIENQQHQPFKTVQVEFADGKSARGSVVGVDDITDVGVVKVPRGHLPTLRFQKDLPQVGELDVVIGSPLGLEETVTAGIISALHRDMPPSSEQPQGAIDLIQTDAPISPGNSGGAVVDANSDVLGLSEAYVPPQAGAVAIGFVTPAATVTSVADQLLSNGTVKHAYLGVQLADITPQVANAYGLPSSGALIQSVGQGTPAAQAGLQPGDVITSFGGKHVANVTDVLAALRGQQPGDQVTVQVMRNGSTHSVTLTLADRPHS